jgi:hypothetical protein
MMKRLAGPFSVRVSLGRDFDDLFCDQTSDRVVAVGQVEVFQYGLLGSRDSL